MSELKVSRPLRTGNINREDIIRNYKLVANKIVPEKNAYVDVRTPQRTRNYNRYSKNGVLLLDGKTTL